MNEELMQGEALPTIDETTPINDQSADLEVPEVAIGGEDEDLYGEPLVSKQDSDNWRQGFLHSELVFDEAAKSVGMANGNPYNSQDWKRLVDEVNSDDIIVRKRALAEIVNNPKIPAYQKLQAGDALIKLESIYVPDGGFRNTSAKITQRAMENSAMDDGVYEDNAGIYEEAGSVTGTQFQDLALGADSSKWLAQFEAGKQAGASPEQLGQMLLAGTGSKSKILSWDTAALMTGVGGVTEMSRSYAMIASIGNPKLDKVLNRYTSDSFVNEEATGTGWLGANATYRTFLRNVSDVVAKEFSDAEKIDMMKKYIQWINTPNKYTSGDGNWHIYAQVIQATLEEVINPKYNSATAADVKKAYEEQGLLGAAVKTFDTPMGDKIAVMSQDLLAALSWVPYVALGKTTLRAASAKLVNAIPPTVNRVMVARPKAFNSSLARTIQTNPEALDAAGVGKIDDIMMNALPSTQDLYNARGARPNVAPYMQNIAEQANTVKQAIINISNNYVTMLDDVKIVDGMKEYVKGKDIAPWANMSAISAKDGAINVSGTWGNTPEMGFKTAAEATSALKRAFGSDVVVEPVLRNKLTQQLIRPTDDGYEALVKIANKSDSYDWVGSVEYNTSIDNWANVPELIETSIVGQNMNWAEKLPMLERISKTADYLTTKTAIGRAVFRSSLGKLFISPLSWTTKEVSSKLTYFAGNNRRIQEILQNATQPFNSKLWQGEKDELNALILRQFKDKFDGTYNVDELISMGVTSQRVQEAYWWFRAMEDVAYEFADSNFAKSLRGQDFEDLLDGDGLRIGFAKKSNLGEVAANYSGPVRIIDSGVTDVMQKNVRDILALTEGGEFELYAMKQAEWFGDEEILYTLVRKEDVPKHLMRIPDRGVLPYRAGYYTEIHEAPFAIYGMTPNNKKYYIGTANSTAGAKAAVETVKNSAKYSSRYLPESIGYEPMKGIREEISLTKTTDTPVENMGGIVFGHKRGDLVNFEGDVGVANKLDPLAATQAMFATLGATYTKGRLIQHREVIGDQLARAAGLVTDPKTRVTSVEQLVDSGKLDGEKLETWRMLKDWFETTDAYRILPDMADVVSAKYSRALAGIWAKVATSITGEGAVAKRLNKMAREQEAGQRVAASNPTDLSRVWTSFTHFRNIVMNPYKHLPMNLAQSLQNLAHPMGFAKAVNMFNGFVSAIVANEDALFRSVSAAERNASISRLAKQMGMSKQELENLVDAALSGGVWNAAQHNYMHRAAARTQAELAALGALTETPSSVVIENLKDAVGTSYRTTRTFLEETGHALGENMANISTFLTQYHYLKNTAGFDITKQASKELLVGKTLALAGNMSAEWSVGLQRGFFKAPFQYSAFNLKMLHNFLPESMGGSKLLTGKEKLSMFVSQALLWGADGVIMGRQVLDQFENWFINNPELSPEEREQRRKEYAEDTQLKRVAEQGWLGAGMNEQLHWFTLSALSPDDWEFQEDLNFGDQLAFGGGYDLPYEQMAATIGSVALLAQGTLSTIKGDGWLNDESQEKLLQEALTAFGGSNQKTVLNVQQWMRNVAKVSGDWQAGRRDFVEAVKYVAADTARTALGGFVDKSYWLSVSKQMGIEIQNGRPVGKEWRDTITNRLRMFTGLRLESEQDWARLDDMMREDGAQLAINSKDRKSSVQRKAKGYVDSILNEVAAFPDDRTGIMMSEHVLNKANEDMSYILSALPPREAQELREAIYMEISKAVSPKDSRRDRALKLLGKLSPELHTEEGRNKLMKAAATSESYKNTALGQGLLEFIEQSETTKQINGSNE
jgi:hypothetical protein